MIASDQATTAYRGCGVNYVIGEIMGIITLTKQGPITSPASTGQRNDDLSQEMIEAGLRAFRDWDRSGDWSEERLVAAIYRRMKALDK
jgi:hypothetical protein